MSSLSDTANLILGLFVEHGIKKKHSLSIFELLIRKSQWARNHQDNFNKAINELIDRELIEWGEGYLLSLTDKGYNDLSLSNATSIPH